MLTIVDSHPSVVSIVYHVKMASPVSVQRVEKPTGEPLLTYILLS